MNVMIKKLLQGQAVEWRALGEICEFRNGFAFKSNLFKDIGTPVIRITNLNNGLIDLSDVKYCNPDDYNVNLKSYEINEGDILIAMSGATTGKIGFYNHNQTSFLNQRVGKFIPNQSKLNNRYLYHFLLSRMKELYILAGGGAQPNLSSNKIMNEVKIPIPPLSVQSQIVQILDTFTELTAELTAELSMRQKQYQYYRDFLLSEHELAKVGFEWKSLGEVGELVRGNGLTKKDLSDDGVPAIHYGQIYTHFGTFATQTKSFVSTALAKKLKKAQNGDVLLAGTSENLKDVMKPLGWLGGEIAISGDMFAFRPNKQQLDTKYLTYLLQAHEFQKYKEKHAHGTKVTRLKSEKFLSFVIPIPPLSVQSQIVAILDTFDTLTQSISEGLPKEIQLRQKQYEYYRELLLGFDTQK